MERAEARASARQVCSLCSLGSLGRKLSYSPALVQGITARKGRQGRCVTPPIALHAANLTHTAWRWALQECTKCTRGALKFCAIPPPRWAVQTCGLSSYFFQQVRSATNAMAS
jgi:hypothetical protein